MSVVDMNTDFIFLYGILSLIHMLTSTFRYSRINSYYRVIWVEDSAQGNTIPGCMLESSCDPHDA